MAGNVAGNGRGMGGEWAGNVKRVRMQALRRLYNVQIFVIFYFSVFSSPKPRSPPRWCSATTQQRGFFQGVHGLPQQDQNPCPSTHANPDPKTHPNPDPNQACPAGSRTWNCRLKSKIQAQIHAQIQAQFQAQLQASRPNSRPKFQAQIQALCAVSNNVPLSRC